MLTDANGEERKGIEIRYRPFPTESGWHCIPTEMDSEAAISEWGESVPQFYETMRDLMLAGF